MTSTAGPELALMFGVGAALITVVVEAWPGCSYVAATSPPAMNRTGRPTF